MWSKLLPITENAAIASSNWIGIGDEKNADDAAVSAMRQAFKEIDISGTIVIGEGERDKAPMLFIGEKVGSGGREVDIAVDPLEGTTICANAAPGAMSVVAIARCNSLLHAPDIYMDKMAVGPEMKQSGLDLDPYQTCEHNITLLSQAKNMPIENICVAILKRDRNQDYIDQVRQTGARVMLINDGDVAAAIATCIPNSGIDMYIGIGGAPEGVLAAVAIKGLDGAMCGKLIYANGEEQERAKNMGIDTSKEYYSINEIVKGNDAIFIASGVTAGYLLDGIKTTCKNGQTEYIIESMVVDVKEKTIIKIQKKVIKNK